MLMTLETCDACGGDFDVQEAPGGLCPVCLMQRGVEMVSTASLMARSTPAAHPQFVPPDPVELEADLPDYDVLELLGQGGMGAVYKARHRGLDRVVAVKVLPRREGLDPQLAERLAREARALARLKHEHIVMAFDAGLTERYAYVVMEFIDGPNLRQLLAGGALPAARAIEIAGHVCQALCYAHENGVLHRDIKPENVLIGPGGTVKLADFGLAKLREPAEADYLLTTTQQLMGTLHYMAPEQTESPRTADHRADLYALGVMLYEMLTGELPLGVFDPPSRKTGVVRRADEVVLHALAKDPANRFATAADFLVALVEFGDAQACDSASVRPLPKTGAGRGGVRRRVFVAAGFAALALVAYFGWQFLLRYDKDEKGNVSLEIKAGNDDKPTGSKQPIPDVVPKQPSASAAPLGEPVPYLNQNKQFNNPAGLNSFPNNIPRQEGSLNGDQNPAAQVPSGWANQLSPLGGANWAATNQSPSMSAYSPSGGSLSKNNISSAEANPNRNKPEVNVIELKNAEPPAGSSATEDLPILLSHPVQQGAYPEKSLTLDYQVQAGRLAKDGNYYLVIEGDHIGHSEMSIKAASFAEKGKLKVDRLPEAGNGEPLRIYIEAEKPAFGRSRVRASNIVKTTVKIAGEPKGEIRYPDHLAVPAAAIHWAGDALQVDIKGEWYDLLEIDGLAMHEIMALAKKARPDNPHKQFEEHLPDLLARAGHKPGDKANLKVRKLETREEMELNDLSFKPEQ